MQAGALCIFAGLTVRRLLLFGLLVAAPIEAQTRGRLAGAIIARDSHEPLPYGVVSVPALKIELFADDSGRFTLASLPVGVVQINVRRLGFAPITVLADIRPDIVNTISIELVRVSLKLRAFVVRALPTCSNPGAPTIARDSTLAAVFEQLLLNARQYLLLSEQYPFKYTMHIQRSRKLKASRDVVLLDEEQPEISSRLREPYVPGQMIRRRGMGQHFLIPTLVDFADDRFIAAHCFHYGGVENVGDSSAIRIDIVAADRIRSPDVEGSIYLDPGNYQIRRTVLHLSKKPSNIREIDALEVITDFKEVLPSIPLVASVGSTLTINPRAKRNYDEQFESHRLLSVEFEGAVPGKP